MEKSSWQQYVDGWDGIDGIGWLSQVVGSLRAASVLISSLINININIKIKTQYPTLRAGWWQKRWREWERWSFQEGCGGRSGREVRPPWKYWIIEYWIFEVLNIEYWKIVEYWMFEILNIERSLNIKSLKYCILKDQAGSCAHLGKRTTFDICLSTISCL